MRKIYQGEKAETCTLYAIETEGLTKVYRGKENPAIADVTLNVGSGELFGFLGPNGAGKTTMIRILTTLLRPTRGRARVAGHDVLEEPQEAMRKVGFMPENPGFYYSLTGRQHLRYWASLYRLDGSQQKIQIDELLRRVGLADSGDVKAKAYSLGMKRRLALAGALLPDPEILILDEPSLGLDPQGMIFVRSLLKELHGEGRSVFLSSHLLDEVQRICTQVGILTKGRLIRVDTPRNLAHIFGRTGATLEVETRGVNTAVLDQLRSIEGVDRVEAVGTLLHLYGSTSDDAVAEVNRRLVAAGVAVLGSRRLEPDLETAFLALTEGQA